MQLIIKKIFNLMWLMRLPIVSVSLLLALIALKLSGTSNSCAIIALACIISAGYIQNDLFDIEIDFISAPQRPLPSGVFSVYEAKLAYTILVIFGLLLGWRVNGLLYFIYLCFVLYVFYIYSTYCKAYWLIKNLFTAITSTTVIMVPYFCGGETNSQIISLGKMAFSFTLGREIFMDIRDLKGDLRIPNVRRPTRNFALVFSVFFLLFAFFIKEKFFLKTNFFRYFMYCLILLLIYKIFKNIRSKYWIGSESMKIIYIIDLISIYFTLIK